MKQYNKSIRGKLFLYFQQRLKLKKSTKGWSRCDCIFCGGAHTMGIQFTQSRVKCFKCEEVSTPVNLLMYIEGFKQLREAWEFLKIQQEYEAYSDYDVKVYDRKQVILPESFKLMGTEDSMLSRYANRYMVKKRKIPLPKLIRRGIGFCTLGPYAGYIIFPFYQNSQLVFFQGRRFIETNSKMKNPGEEDFGVGKTEVMYNQDALFIYNRIYLVESITNALTMGDKGVAILGKTISPYQLKMILKSPVDEVVILLDMDAIDKAISLALQLCNYKKVKLIYWGHKEKIKDKDVNNLGRKKIMEFVKAQPFQSYMDIFRFKLKLNGKSAESAHIHRSVGYNSKRGA